MLCAARMFPRPQVCTDSFVPEFWMLRYPATATNTQGLASHSVVGFVAGTHMAKIAHKSHDEVGARACTVVHICRICRPSLLSWLDHSHVLCFCTPN